MNPEPTPLHSWPPTLADIRAWKKIPDSNTNDDANLASDLAAAIAYVQRVRPTFNYTGDIGSSDPLPTDDLWNGTVRYAARLFTRRSSPDGMVSMGDMGVGRVAIIDPDIDKLLGIGRFAPATFF